MRNPLFFLIASLVVPRLSMAQMQGLGPGAAGGGLGASGAAGALSEAWRDSLSTFFKALDGSNVRLEGTLRSLSRLDVNDPAHQPAFLPLAQALEDLGQPAQAFGALAKDVNIAVGEASAAADKAQAPIREKAFMKAGALIEFLRTPEADDVGVGLGKAVDAMRYRARFGPWLDKAEREVLEEARAAAAARYAGHREAQVLSSGRKVAAMLAGVPEDVEIVVARQPATMALPSGLMRPNSVMGSAAPEPAEEEEPEPIPQSRSLTRAQAWIKGLNARFAATDIKVERRDVTAAERMLAELRAELDRNEFRRPNIYEELQPLKENDPKRSVLERELEANSAERNVLKGALELAGAYRMTVLVLESASRAGLLDAQGKEPVSGRWAAFTAAAAAQWGAFVRAPQRRLERARPAVEDLKVLQHRLSEQVQRLNAAASEARRMLEFAATQPGADEDLSHFQAIDDGVQELLGDYRELARAVDMAAAQAERAWTSLQHPS